AKFANLAGLSTADRERLANRLWNGSEAQKCGRYLHDEVALLAASNQPGFDEDDPVAVWQTTVRQAAAQTEISHGAGNFLLPLFPERPL
ncbi:hypothetical protein KJ596_02290, partial [Patescibacteria group bacterium]|nr:hypothetical protein [Patescibacteria group bacterium]MBU1868265.1 hypothetical protein [Patescibacteria group bacterium]